jgi:L-asparaginase
MKLIIHGGFFSESSTNLTTKLAKQESLKNILTKSYTFLENHSALETVVFAVEMLENDPLFNAGIGSQIQNDGNIRMSASIMDGETKKFSGVINIQDVENPVRIAEKLMEFDDRVLGADGALNFARDNHFSHFNPEIPQRREEYESKVAALGLGTVGCVALDKNGKIAASTSTGGKGFEIPGRISDSATIAGNFANEFCGVSCTGVGEDIVSGAVAAKIAIRVSDGFKIEKAFSKTFDELKPFDGFAGAIAIDNQGNIFHQDSHPSMFYGSFDGNEFDIFD